MTWNKTEIQQARKVPLKPLLESLGYDLREKVRGNYCVVKFGDLIVKEHYWRWKSENLQGNAINFLILVENKTFTESMTILCPKE